MSTHNICFYGELKKLFLNYHQIPFLPVPLILCVIVHVPVVLVLTLALCSLSFLEFFLFLPH